MSTAVDTAFEEIMSASGDAGEPMHGACAVCYQLPLAEVVITICGKRVSGGYPAAEGGAGRHKCATCLTRRFWPCGHHR